MTRGSIVASLASLSSKGLVITFSILLLLLPMMISASSIDIISEHIILTTPNHQAWAFAPTPMNNNNASYADQGNNITTSSTNQPTNHAPIADNKTDVTTIQSTPVKITLSGSDADNEPIQFAIGSFPSNGSLSGFDTSPNSTNTTVTYTPNQDFLGKDSLTYTVTDNKGAVSNKAATVSITVIPEPNSKPTVEDSQSIETD